MDKITHTQSQLVFRDLINPQEWKWPASLPYDSFYRAQMVCQNINRIQPT